MSTTALILTQTIARRAALVERLGLRAIEQSLFAVAARLIAGTYEN